MSSYVLDRDVLLTALGSGRANAQVTTTHHLHSTEQPQQQYSSNGNTWIDVNSNAALIGNGGIYQRSLVVSHDGETRKQMSELQDQMRMMRSDLERKDKLILELSNYRETEKARPCECSKVDAIFRVDRSSVETSELKALSAKFELVENDAKEEKIGELKLEIESLKTENSSLNACIVTQRNKIRELENELSGFEGVACKSSMTITSLQQDNKNLQKTLLELESRIKTHMMEREEAERRTEMITNKLSELAVQVSSATGIEITGSVSGLEFLIKKLSEVVTETNTLKGRLMTVSEQYSSSEAECRASRDTIQRLVAEVSKFEKEMTAVRISVDQLRAERDLALNNQSLYVKEVETYKERMNNVQMAWQATKTELEQARAFVNGQSANYKQLEYDSLYAKNCLAAFKEQIATLLSDGFVKVEANEEEIKEKVKLLMVSSKDRGLMIASMEGKLQQLASQLTEQVNMYKEIEAKYHRAEAHSIELETKFKSLDSEYCANETLRESLKSDRIKYFAFLERLGCLLRVSEISADLGLDMNIDLLIARIEQLVRSENDSLQDKQTNIYNLQRKVKSLKEQLDSKELHLDLLRKKLAGLEEERSAKCALEKEVDDHVTMSKKFKIKVEKLTEQLNGLRCENENLKSCHVDVNGLRTRINDQEKEVARLLCRITELESVKEKQACKIAKYKEELDSYSSEMSKTRSSTDTAVTALSHELRTLKVELEKTIDREKQLLDFRCVIARMLGLDVNSLAVADYEIISRIERIITSFNEGLMPVHVSTTTTTTPSVAATFQPMCIQPVPYDYGLGSTNSTDNHHHHHHHHGSSKQQQHRASVVQHSHSFQDGLNQHHRHSQSPHRHSGRHQQHHHHHVTESSSESSPPSGSSTRARSKSPRKVTIDPKAY